jgi:hypothetical protein
MGKTFDQGKNDVAKLGRYFETNRSMFLAPGVKEAHIRQTLIDPFFMALGPKRRPNTAKSFPKTASISKANRKRPIMPFASGRNRNFIQKPRNAASTLTPIPVPRISFADMDGALKSRSLS